MGRRNCSSGRPSREGRARRRRALPSGRGPTVSSGGGTVDGSWAGAPQVRVVTPPGGRTGTLPARRSATLVTARGPNRTRPVRCPQLPPSSSRSCTSGVPAAFRRGPARPIHRATKPVRRSVAEGLVNEVVPPRDCTSSRDDHSLQARLPGTVRLEPSERLSVPALCQAFVSPVDLRGTSSGGRCHRPARC